MMMARSTALVAAIGIILRGKKEKWACQTDLTLRIRTLLQGDSHQPWAGLVRLVA